MTTLTDTQVVTASGGLVELGYSQITSSVSLGTTLTNVTSTLTVVCDGGPILVEFYAPSARCFGTDNMSIALFEDGVQKAEPWGESVGSASTVAATPVYLTYRLSPSAGSHTYQVRAKSNQSQQIRAGSGGTGSPAYAPAFLRVSKIVQATQWPAVTTGTIICTSTTRPASPFEGQEIYETDTDLSLTWSGSAWVQTGSIGAWTSFTPTVTGYGGLSLSNGNATIEGKYTRIGRTVHFRARWVLGSTTSFNNTNGYFFCGLPITSASQWNPGVWASLLDSGSSHYIAMPMMGDGSTSGIGVGGVFTGSTYASQAAPTVMFSWTPGDSIFWGGTYEAAS